MKQKTKFRQTELGMILEDWELINLGKVCSKIGSGITPRGGEKVYTDSGTALIRSQNVHNNSFRKDGLAYIDEPIAKEMENVIVEKNDVLLNITGDSVARCCTVPEEVLPARVNQHVSIIRTDKQKLAPVFLRYWLTSPKMQAIMLSLAQSGGTRNALTKGMIEKFAIPKPAPEEQIAISKILYDLDSKIELNQQMNKTLEAIGQAIFKHWFVDFEFPNEIEKPYKSSGGKMSDSELGKIPKGWRVMKLGEYVNVVKGCSYRSIDLKESETALVTLKSINRGGGLNKDGYKEYVGEYNEDQILNDGDIVVAQTDLTQKAEVIGRPAVVNSLDKYSTLVASLDLQIVRPKNNFSKNYVYYLLKTEEFHNHALSYTNGTTVLHLNKNAVPKFISIIPSKEILDKFDNIIESILTKIAISESEIQTLSYLRDSLLPKLMSGKIRVPVEVKK